MSTFNVGAGAAGAPSSIAFSSAYTSKPDQNVGQDDPSSQAPKVDLESMQDIHCWELLKFNKDTDDINQHFPDGFIRSMQIARATLMQNEDTIRTLKAELESTASCSTCVKSPRIRKLLDHDNAVYVRFLVIAIGALAYVVFSQLAAKSSQKTDGLSVFYSVISAITMAGTVLGIVGPEAKAVAVFRKKKKIEEAERQAQEARNTITTLIDHQRMRFKIAGTTLITVWVSLSPCLNKSAVFNQLHNRNLIDGPATIKRRNALAERTIFFLKTSHQGLTQAMGRFLDKNQIQHIIDPFIQAGRTIHFEFDHSDMSRHLMVEILNDNPMLQTLQALRSIQNDEVDDTLAPTHTKTATTRKPLFLTGKNKESVFLTALRRPISSDDEKESKADGKQPEMPGTLARKPSIGSAGPTPAFALSAGKPAKPPSPPFNAQTALAAAIPAAGDTALLAAASPRQASPAGSPIAISMPSAGDVITVEPQAMQHAGPAGAASPKRRASGSKPVVKGGSPARGSTAGTLPPSRLQLQPGSQRRASGQRPKPAAS